MTTRERRAKGEGGFQKRADGWVRGYKTFSGRRVWTRWYRNRTLASEAMKQLRAPIEEKTVLAAIDGFLSVSNLAASTRGGYEQSANHYLAPLHSLNCHTLTFKRVSDHYRSMRDAGLSLSTIRQAHAVLKGSLAYALNNDWVDQNVAAAVRLPQARRAKIEGLDERAREAVLAALRDHPYEARFRLGIIWGLRPGEATGLTWQHVNFSDGTIRIAGQLQRSKVDVEGVRLGTIYRRAVKSDAGARTIWPDAQTLQILYKVKIDQRELLGGRELTPAQSVQRRSQADRLARAKELNLLGDATLYEVPPADLVFTLANGDPLLPRYDADMWKALLEAAGVAHVRLYAGRHTAANHLLARGAPLSAVSALMGHSSQAFTQRVYGGSLDVLSDGLADFI